MKVDTFTSLNKKNEIYSDFLTNLTSHPDGKDLLRITNEDSVKRSIRNLIMTDKLERLYQPDIGSNIRKLLFELPTPQLSNQIKNEIQETITNHEPRAKLISIDVIENSENESYKINILYYIINKIEPVSATITLYRVR